MQKPSVADMRKEGLVIKAGLSSSSSPAEHVLLDSGIVYLSQPVTHAFLELSEMPPLDR